METVKAIFYLQPSQTKISKSESTERVLSSTCEKGDKKRSKERLSILIYREKIYNNIKKKNILTIKISKCLIYVSRVTLRDPTFLKFVICSTLFLHLCSKPRILFMQSFFGLKNFFLSTKTLFSYP